MSYIRENFRGMKGYFTLFGLVCVLLFGCTKDPIVYGSASDNYTGFYDFISKNEVKIQTYIINATAGGTFATPQGTTVIIPPNAFVMQSGTPVSGNVTIEFKDIYKKSDMLLSNILPVTTSGQLLKSGGEFFIKALSNGTPVYIEPGKMIDIKQPINLTGGPDTAMEAFMGQFENFSIPTGWFLAPMDSMVGPGPMAYTSMDTVAQQANYYVFSLYQFSAPATSGSWCNSDNPVFFQNYSTDSINIIANDDPVVYGTEVYLIFTGINAMVHLYKTGLTYPYYTAPLGLQCTVVAVGFKDGDLYSAFVPIMIASDQTVNFTLSKTTTSAFISQLNSLN